MENTNLNFNEIIVNPIEGFYNKINNNIDVILNEYFEKNNNNTSNLELINQLDQKIQELENEIVIKKQEMKISSLKTANVFIIIFCFLIIGLFLLPIYLKNKEIINEFNKFANENFKKISLLEEKKRNEIMSIFSNLNLYDICNHVYEQFGIKTTNYINFDLNEISDSLNFGEDHVIIDILSGIKGIVKNSIFYDLLVRIHYYANVTTSKSKSFPYEEYVRDQNGTRVEIRYETLTAYHHEITPFIDEKNIVVYKTNYNTELFIKNNAAKSDKKSIFENKDFAQKIRIIDFSNNPQKLMECFTVKAQEEFVNWYNREDGNIFDFVKSNDNFFIINNDISNGVLRFLNAPLDENGIANSILYSDIANIDNLKQNIKNALTNYFIIWAKMVQLPLLIPGISREWYNTNKKYLIAQSKELEPIQLQKVEKIEPINIINNLLHSKYIWFNDSQVNSIIKRPMWITFDNNQNDDQICKVCLMNLNSYYSQIHYDDVVVHGYHVGTKIISVPYERFYPVNEPKLLIFKEKNNYKSKNNFVVSYTLNKLISPNHYEDKNFYETISDLNIWVHNTNDFEKSLDREKLIMNFQRFQQLNIDHELGATLKMDNFGVQIIVNKYDVEQAIVNKLIDIATKLNLINY